MRLGLGLNSLTLSRGRLLRFAFLLRHRTCLVRFHDRAFRYRRDYRCSWLGRRYGTRVRPLVMLELCLVRRWLELRLLWLSELRLVRGVLMGLSLMLLILRWVERRLGLLGKGRLLLVWVVRLSLLQFLHPLLLQLLLLLVLKPLLLHPLLMLFLLLEPLLL